MAILEIKINSYPEQAKKLVDIWNTYLKSDIWRECGVDVITFVHKRPKRIKNNNRRIAGLPAQCISYLEDDTELVKMSAENFIYLMAKCGVNIQVNEKTDGADGKGSEGTCSAMWRG
jgi:hypothetical protein